MRLLVLILVFTSCRVGSPYEPPCTPIPDTWKGPENSNAEKPSFDEWWEIFEDETLNSLEESAIENSPTLYIALEKVMEARAIAGVFQADLFPQLNLNPSYTSTGTLFKIFLPSSGQNLGDFPSVFRIHQMQYLLPLNLSYELDLWGRLKDQYEAATFNEQAEQEAFYTTRLTLTSDLASAYFKLRTFDTELDLLNATIDARQRNYNVVKQRFDKGLITSLDVSQATLELANAEAAYFDILRQRNLAENQIAVLAGEVPSQFCLPHNPLQNEPPKVPAALPCQVLMQRPDVAQAERTIASEHAQVNAAYASFFPSFNLTGTIGYSSPDLKHFLSWKSRYWQVGANASQFVFDGGRHCSNLDLAWARFGQASGNYQKTVLTAFQEVEDALQNIELEEKQWQKLNLATESAKQASQITSRRYKGGLVPYLDVIESERFELEAESNAIQVLGSRYLVTVQLIKAIGGGWGDYDCAECSFFTE